MNNSLSLAGAALAAGMVLAAAPAGAQILKLDCDVSVDTYNVTESRAGRDSGSSWGTWKVRFFLYEDDPGLSSAKIEESAPFGLSRFGPTMGLDFDYLESSITPSVTDDRIEWCPHGRRGCDVRTLLSGDGSWYSVSKAVIDRRRGTFLLTVNHYDGLLRLREDHTYRGTCAPEPERQF